jgi:hypothetical protein
MAVTGEGLQHGRAGDAPASKKLLVVLVVILIALVAWDVVLQMRGPAPPTPEVQARVAALLLFDAARAIERHRAASGTLPVDLSTLQLPDAGYAFMRADTGYSVSVRMEDVSATYRSGDDLWSLLEQAGVR